MSYEPPKNDSSTLYINTGGDAWAMNLVEILEHARGHFTGDFELGDLHIAPDLVKVQGCSCCFDMSDYTNYLRVDLIRS